MKLGTHIRLPDGREATVVYNSLIGVGIKWGLHNPDPADFEGTDGNTVSTHLPNPTGSGSRMHYSGNRGMAVENMGSPLNNA